MPNKERPASADDLDSGSRRGNPPTTLRLFLLPSTLLPSSSRRPPFLSKGSLKPTSSIVLDGHPSSIQPFFPQQPDLRLNQRNSECRSSNSASSGPLSRCDLSLVWCGWNVSLSGLGCLRLGGKVTTRYVDLQPVGMGTSLICVRERSPRRSLLERFEGLVADVIDVQVPLVLYGASCLFFVLFFVY